MTHDCFGNFPIKVSYQEYQRDKLVCLLTFNEIKHELKIKMIEIISTRNIALKQHLRLQIFRKFNQNKIHHLTSWHRKITKTINLGDTRPVTLVIVTTYAWLLVS